MRSRQNGEFAVNDAALKLLNVSREIADSDRGTTAEQDLRNLCLALAGAAVQLDTLVQQVDALKAEVAELRKL